MKVLIFDSSSLISLSMNGLLPELKRLKEHFNGKFIITKDVKYEVVDRPLKIKRFEFEALRAKSFIEEKVLGLPDCLEVREEEINMKTSEIMDLANSMFVGRGKNVNMIHKGEASCLGLAKILDKKGIENVLCIDERTMRMLIEKPENLQKLLSKKLHINVRLKQSNFKFFKGFKVIRSCELIYIAFKKKLFRWKSSNILDAVLWALKFKGCAVSRDEIEKIKKIN